MKSLLLTLLVISSYVTCMGQTPPNGPEVTDPEWNAYDIETVVDGFNIPWGLATFIFLMHLQEALKKEHTLP